jgi:O-antigen/teichoic acid export membrane protein
MSSPIFNRRARALGATSFGIISIAQIPISIGLLFINASVSNAIVNFIAENRHEENVSDVRNIVYAGFIINIIIGVVTTLILYIFSGYISNHFFSRPETEPLIKILSISIFATSLLNTGYAVLVGFEHMNQRNILSIIYSILKCARA